MSFEWHWLYFVAGIIFILIEVFSFTFYFLPIGIAAIITGIFALFIQNIYIHVAIFVVTCISLLVFISKWRKSRFLKPSGSQFVAGLVGQFGVVIENYKSTIEPGKVKIFSDIWEIHWDAHHDKMLIDLKIGDHVKVVSVEGNKVVVEKVKV
jgi:inner membrane protein